MGNVVGQNNFWEKVIKRSLLAIASLSLVCVTISGCGRDDLGEEVALEYQTICDEYKDVSPKYVFSYAENQAIDYPTSLGAIRFAYLVHEKSKGRIQIKVYTDAELGDEPDLVKELTRGGLDFIRASMSGLTEYNDEANVLVMPYLYEDADHMWRVLDGDIGQEIMDSFNGTGMVPLSWYDAGVRNFYSSEPIHSLEDLSGKVIRIQESDIMSDIITDLGATPYATMFDEVYSALQTGRVDMAENNLSSYESMEHYKVAPYFIVDEHTRIPELQLISQTTYDKLTDEEKEIIISSAKESALYERELWKEREEISLERVKEGGCQIIYLSDKEKERFRDAVSGVYTKYCKDYMDLIERIQNY